MSLDVLLKDPHIPCVNCLAQHWELLKPNDVFVFENKHADLKSKSEDIVMPQEMKCWQSYDACYLAAMGDSSFYKLRKPLVIPS